MKISIEQANKLLSALQADAEVVENDQDADAATDIESFVTGIQQSVRASVEEQLKPSLEAGFTGRYLGALRSAAQRVFGVHKRELEDMSIEQVLATCKTAVDNIAADATLGYETAMQQLRTEHEHQLSTERAKYLQRDIAARCIAILQQLPRKGGDVQEQADMLKYKMHTAYDVRYNEESNKLELFKDGKAALNDKNEALTDEAFALAWAGKAGILVQDTRHIKPADVLAGTQGIYADAFVANNGANTANAMEAITAWAEQE